MYVNALRIFSNLYLPKSFCNVKNAMFHAVTMLCQCLKEILVVVVLWNCILVASLQMNRLSISESSGRYLNFIHTRIGLSSVFIFEANPKIKYFKFIYEYKSYFP